MINAYLGNFNGALTEKEVDDICEKAKLHDIELFCETKYRGPVNAAIDDMVSDVLIAFNSDIFSGACNLIALSSTVCTLVKSIYNYINKRGKHKVTVNKIERVAPNVNIEIENITILNPKVNDINLEKYYNEAFIITKEEYKNNQNNEYNNIIVEYDMETKRARSYTAVEYAYKIMNERKRESNE